MYIWIEEVKIYWKTRWCSGVLREKKYEEDEKTSECIDSEMRKKEIMKDLGEDEKTRE